MGIFTCLTSGEQKCGKTKFKAIDYCRNRAYSTNLKIFTRCQHGLSQYFRALTRGQWWRYQRLPVTDAERLYDDYVFEDIIATMSGAGLCRVSYKSDGSEGVRRGSDAI